MTMELKACPFCGSEAKVIRPMGDRLPLEERVSGGGHYGPNHYRVVCTAPWEKCGQGCGKSTPTLSEAIAAWNTRTPDPEILSLRARVAELEGREGWVLVPIEPTWEMLEAAKNGVALSPSLDALMKKGLRANWRDMIATLSKGEATEGTSHVTD